jgi:hypothetical protein
MATLTGRHRLIRVTRIVLLVLLALTLWRASQVLYDLVSRERVQGVAAFEGGRFLQAWHAAVVAKLVERHEVVCGALFLVCAAALLIRLIFAYRAMDFLYLESGEAAERSFTGYLFNLSAIVGQLALIYAIVAAVESRSYLHVPLLLLLTLAINSLWLFFVYLGAERSEKGPLRGVWRSALLSALFALGVFAYLWLYEAGRAVESDDVRRLTVASICGVAMGLLCAVEGYIQAQTYGAKKKISAFRYSLAAVIAAIFLGLALYIITAGFFTWR